MATAFTRRETSPEQVSAAEVDKLHSKIGQLVVDAKIKISMDGKGAWRDNRMIERLWRSLKYECVYLNAFETGSEMRAGIGKWLGYYNTERPHSTHGLLTPDEAYASKTQPMKKQPKRTPDPP